MSMTGMICGRVIPVLAALWVTASVGPVLAAADSKAAAPAAGKASEFPLRSRYIDVAVLETADLDRRFNEFVIVDVRSQYEYDTLRIKDAVLIPVSDRDFVERVRELRVKTTKGIAFYCNGKTCAKSYDATIMAMSARIPNVVCYDAGVFDWARAHPERAALLGKSPVKREDLIDDSAFKGRLLAPKDFEARIGAASLVLDVRDRVQRDTALFPFRELRAQLSETDKLDAAIEQARREKKTLLIYDQVGKQVQWFQYHVEARGLKDYYFMKGGAQAWFDATYGKVVLGKEGKN